MGADINTKVDFLSAHLIIHMGADINTQVGFLSTHLIIHTGTDISKQVDFLSTHLIIHTGADMNARVGFLSTQLVEGDTDSPFPILPCPLFCQALRERRRKVIVVTNRPSRQSQFVLCCSEVTCEVR